MKSPTHPGSPWATETLVATDPEFTEYFNNFAFDEVLSGPALETGYRHIDTAAANGNEREVGAGIRRSGVD